MQQLGRSTERCVQI